MRNNDVNKNLRMVVGTLLFTISLPTFSQHIQPAAHFYISAGVQANNLEVKHINSIPTPGLLPQEFHTTGGKTVSFGATLALGYIWAFNPVWSLHSGIAAYFNNHQKVNGRYYATPYTPGDTNPYTAYYYNLQTSQYMVESNLWFHFRHRFDAFAGAGLGLSHVQTSALSFDEAGSVLPPATANVSNDYLATSLDAGLAYNMTQRSDVSFSLKKSWLGTNDISISDGSSDTMVKANVHRIDPWQFKLSVAYYF